MKFTVLEIENGTSYFKSAAVCAYLLKFEDHMVIVLSTGTTYVMGICNLYLWTATLVSRVTYSNLCIDFKLIAFILELQKDMARHSAEQSFLHEHLNTDSEIAKLQSIMQSNSIQQLKLSAHHYDTKNLICYTC